MWSSMVKRETAKAGILATVEALHALREKGSDLSPVLWAWWRMTKKLEEPEATGFEFLHIWSANALKSSKMRRWFYQETAFEFMCRRKFWPSSSAVALETYKEFEADAAKLPPQEHRALWQAKYKVAYDAALADARNSRDDARYKVARAAADSDLGVWLSASPMAYLKCGAASNSLVKTKSTTVLTRKKRQPKT